MNPNECSVALLAYVERLDPVLHPHGFTFKLEQDGVSSGGPFASGFFRNDWLGIGMIVRYNGLGAIIYETPEADASHDSVIKLLGETQNQKVFFDMKKMVSHTIDNQDLLTAVVYDIKHIIGPMLADRTKFEDTIYLAHQETLKRMLGKQYDSWIKTHPRKRGGP
jgi:hypothetical protein